jgi:membrane associated rhomboid family serine protease
MDTPVVITSNRRQADEWALVLVSEGVPVAVQRESDGYSLRVRDSDALRAMSILDLYALENLPPPAVEVEPHHPGAFNAALAAMGTLLIFFMVTGARNHSVRWFDRGSADAAQILSGELWRTITALTLHADLGHVLGNVVAGTLFVTPLGRSLGPGLAILLVLVAGAGGNFVNAILHGTAHSSVGASTSVFGAVGLLGGRGVVRRGRTGARGHRRWAPFAGGLALLAMLGTGPRADLGGHLFGLLVGVGLGILVALAIRRPPSTAMQWLLGATAVLAVLYSWGLALD